jgi:hypothetical protein
MALQGLWNEPLRRMPVFILRLTPNVKLRGGRDSDRPSLTLFFPETESEANYRAFFRSFISRGFSIDQLFTRTH